MNEGNISLSCFTIDKNAYFSTILSSFKDAIKLFEAFKLDFNRIGLTFNGYSYDNPYEFVSMIKCKYPEYLQPILLLCNQNAHFYYYNTIFSIIQKYNTNLNLVSSNYSNNDDITNKYFKTIITINPFIRQVSLENIYDIIDVSDCVKTVHKKLKVNTIIDLVINSPVIIKIEWLL